MTHLEHLNARLERAKQTEQAFGLNRKRRALDRAARQEDRLYCALGYVIAALLSGVVVCLILLITGV